MKRTLLLSVLLAAPLSVAVSAPMTAQANLQFRERSNEWGTVFQHHHGGSGERYMVETVVGGVLAFDYDGDGDDDVLWVDGGVLPGFVETQLGPPRTVLLRNDSGRFVDVTERSKLVFSGYGCGGTAADIDGDGDIDVLVTAFGENALFVNQGDGTFSNEVERRGLSDPRWNSSAAFADADLDGDLDLYVGGYVDFTLDNHKICGKPEVGMVGYCHPNSYEGERDHFYLNDGRGFFEEVGESAGLTAAREATLGVIFADVDGDTLPDIYVANDLDPNQLFRNTGRGRFEDVSLLSGTGYSLGGRPEAGMGVEMVDLNQDGRSDLLVTNFALESNAYYRNQGMGLFVDARYPARLAEASLHSLGFGLVAADFDQDGDPDLMVANGHTLDNAEQLSPVKAYAQRNQLMRNEGGTFVEVMDAGLTEVRVSRGLAVSDLDLDGDLDVLIVNSNQLSETYENVGAAPGRFVAVTFGGAGANWSGVGARITVWPAVLNAEDSGAIQARQMRVLKTGASYLSQSQLAVHFGLVEHIERVHLKIEWPRANREALRIEAVPVGRRIEVRSNL